MCRRIFKEQTSETGDIPFYKIGTFGADPDAFISRELFEEYKSKYPYPQKGDILISASGSIGRAVEFAGNNEYFQDSNIVWLNHDERLSNPFLKCFYSVVKWAGIEGSTIKRLYNDNILNTVICMPSVPEQKRIGLFFENLDNLITLHQRQPFLHSTPEISLTVQLIHPFYTSSWEQRKLGDIADIVGGGTPSTGNQSYWDGDIDWYAPAEIADQIYANSSQKKITGLGYENSSAKMLPPGTVLFTSRAGIGKTAILTRKGCTNQGFQSIVPHRGELDSYFIFSRTEELKRYGELVGAGSTFVEVSGKQMAVMELMMPPTMREQQTIGGFFQQLDHLITLHQRECISFTARAGRRILTANKKRNTSSWEQRKLGELVDRVVRKNTNNESTLPLTISAQYGLVDQITYFNNRVASRDVSNYYLVLNGEFAYNKSTSDGYPFGAVKRLDLYEKGVLSTLYIVFAPKKEQQIDSDYLTVFFDTDRWHKGVAERAAEGARNHGLLNISAEDFFDIDLSVPKDIVEQKQIGAFIRQLDNLITLHQRKGKAAVTGCSNDANNSKGVYCKARDFGYKCCKKVESP